MNDKTDVNISKLIEELDSAVLRGDAEKADEITDILFRLQGGKEEDAVMPAQFPGTIAAHNKDNSGSHMKSKSIKRFIGIAAAAALVMTLGMTAFATHLFGLRDMVIKSGQSESVTGSDVTVPNDTGTAPFSTSGNQGTARPSYELIPLQGYPDSNEYKASVEWELFRESYDTDGSIIAQVGNNPNEYTEKYPMYLVYSQEMADKLEEIIAKYDLKLHTSNTIAESPEQLISLAGVGNFLENRSGGVNKAYSGYVYNDGAFAYDGEAILENDAVIQYQLGNYVKGVFSDVCLNVGSADTYKEWLYTTKNGVQVSLALSETKALLIADRENSFVVVNVLAGTGDSGFNSDSITEDDLQSFADMFDFTQIG